jgi:hypothetical protein
MIRVAEVQQYLSNLVSLLRTNGSSQLASDLERWCGSLEAFKDMSLGEFADFLRLAEEHLRTGVLPVKSGKGKGLPKEIDVEKVRIATEVVKGLFERATDPDLQYASIDAEIERLQKELSKEEALEVAHAIGINAAFKLKKEALVEIRRRITDRKASFERVQFFPSSPQPDTNPGPATPPETLPSQ